VSPVRACDVCGVPVLKGGGRCAAHRRARQQRPERGTAAYRQVRAAVLERDAHTCRWCGGPADQVDHHPIPYSAGGPSTEANLVAACGTCNRRRGNRGGAPT
jgi:5-methylcytosine-specific restriction endonuclease McrA